MERNERNEEIKEEKEEKEEEEKGRKKRKSRFDIPPEEINTITMKNYYKDDYIPSSFSFTSSSMTFSTIPPPSSFFTTSTSSNSNFNSNSSSSLLTFNEIKEQEELKLFKQKLIKALNKNLEYLRKKDALLSLPSSQQLLTNINAVPKKVKIDIRNPTIAKRTTGIGAVTQTTTKRQEPNTSVYVTGFPSDITEEEVGILFSVLGRLKKVKLYTHPNGKKKGDALITFNKPEVVPVACVQYNGRDIGGGYILTVTKANFDEYKDNNNLDKNTNNNNNNNTNNNNNNNSITQVFNDEELISKLPLECLSNCYPMAVLWNIYDSEEAALNPEFFCDLEIDLREELNKFGSIISLFTPLHAQLNGVVIIFYDSYQSVQKCVESLKDRIFDGRKVMSHLLNPIKTKRINNSGNNNNSSNDNNSEIITEIMSTHIENNSEEILDPSVIEAVQDVEDFLNSLL